MHFSYVYRPRSRTPLVLASISYGLGSKRSLAVAAFLKTFRIAELRSLNIEGCGVPEPAMATVVRALREEGRGLSSLDISGNQIKTDATATLIAGASFCSRSRAHPGRRGAERACFVLAFRESALLGN